MMNSEPSIEFASGFTVLSYIDAEDYISQRQVKSSLETLGE